MTHRTVVIGTAVATGIVLVAAAAAAAYALEVLRGAAALMAIIAGGVM